MRTTVRNYPATSRCLSCLALSRLLSSAWPARVRPVLITAEDTLSAVDTQSEWRALLAEKHWTVCSSLGGLERVLTHFYKKFDPQMWYSELSVGYTAKKRLPRKLAITHDITNPGPQYSWHKPHHSQVHTRAIIMYPSSTQTEQREPASNPWFRKSPWSPSKPESSIAIRQCGVVTEYIVQCPRAPILDINS